MFYRRFIHLLVGLLLLATLLPAMAQNQPYREIRNSAAGPTDRIEVLEFFAYDCPHCRSFDPLLEKWRTAQKPDVVLMRMPTSFGRPDSAQRARLYLSLRAMGLAERLSEPVFDAVQTQRIALHDPASRDAWLAKQGIDVRKFKEHWRSFSVDAQATRADSLAVAYKISGVPSLVINRRYVIEGGSPEALKTADALIARIRAAQ